MNHVCPFTVKTLAELNLVDGVWGLLYIITQVHHQWLKDSRALILGTSPAWADWLWGYDFYDLLICSVTQFELFQPCSGWFSLIFFWTRCPVSVQSLDVRRGAQHIQVFLRSLRNNEMKIWLSQENLFWVHLCVFLASGLTACRCSAGWRVLAWWPKAFWSKGTWIWSWCSCAGRNPPNCCCTPSAPTCRCRCRYLAHTNRSADLSAVNNPCKQPWGACLSSGLQPKTCLDSQSVALLNWSTTWCWW